MEKIKYSPKQKFSWGALSGLLWGGLLVIVSQDIYTLEFKVIAVIGFILFATGSSACNSLVRYWYLGFVIFSFTPPILLLFVK